MKSYEIKDLVGKTIKTICGGDTDYINFTTEDGYQGSIYHSQDCCERVSIHDTTGDLQGLIGSPITHASEDCPDLPPEDFGVTEEDTEYCDYSYTWTHQILQTEKERVEILWLGSSNGYYSEGVTFEMHSNDE